MNFRITIILLFLIIPFTFSGFAQNKADNICYISNGRMYFNLDKRWKADKKKNISELFKLDSAFIEMAFTGKPLLVYDSITWQVRQIDPYLVEISKTIENEKGKANPGDVFLIDDAFFVKPTLLRPIIAPAKKYGINEFTDKPTVTYQNGVVHFYFQGNLRAGRVYLSGTFNNWSTMQDPMRKTEKGWEISFKLSPGEYQYKYIVDGKWKTDPGNRLKVPDGHAGFNSILFCYNYTFKLAGYTNAKSVILAGSFNNWNRQKLKMNRTLSGWELPVYLPEGTYAYKFIIDGQWINDPANKNLRSDASGNMNSFMGIGDTLVFRLKGFTNARKVVLAGSFNDWNGNELMMNKTATGWEIPYILGAGNYEYKFVVDGRWMPDPANPSTVGSGNFTNSCITFKPNYTFTFSGFPDAKNVLVSGSFNGWSKESYRMVKTGNKWTYPLYLAPGKYTYKFMVDGKWLLDPANELWEENETGTGNSVLWIEP